MIKKEKILAYALENALLHKGEARVDAVLPKLFQEGLKKEEIKKIIPIIKEIVDSVNKLNQDKQAEKFAKLQELIKKKIKIKEELSKLPTAKKGKVVLRFEPSPTGPLHIGHALILLLNYLYKQKYKGKLLLRFADTNPEQINKEAYKQILNDAGWLTNKSIDKIVYQSDRLQIYYRYALSLIKQGKAYVCECSKDKFKSFVNASKPCPCRELPPNEHIKRWKNFSNYKEGQVVLRIKTDLKAKNPALREWPAFRICNKKHPRIKGSKQKVWPLMNFAVAIDDALLGITHVIRGKDHIVNTERQLYIYNYLKFKKPVFVHIGRINFIGMPLSTRETAKAIASGIYRGWDDIRLPFIAAFRKRGFSQKTLEKFAESIGLSKVDKTVKNEEFMKLIYAFNKSIVEKSNRYFFVANPIGIIIKNVPNLKVKIPLHPNFKRGSRQFDTKGEFYITQNDFEQLKENKIYRLMNLFNFIKKGKELEFHSQELNHELMAKPLHWLPYQGAKTKVLMPDGKYIYGMAEKDIKKIKIGTIVQFERFAFCRLIKKGKELEFIFTQK